jgi:4-amino-4-deoxy-L-arabinose transferase-like glycosyltransferase
MSRVLRRYLLFALASLVARALSLAIEVIDMDEASHAIGSWVAGSGGLLYTDFVNNKPPLLYAYYALAQAVLGPGLVPVRLFTALVAVAGTALAASAFFGHERRGLVAGLLYVVFGAAFIGHDVLSANAEVLLLLPASWAVVAVRDAASARRAPLLAAAGFLVGVAFLFKHHAVAWLPALAWAVVRHLRAHDRSRSTRNLAVLVFGFVVPPALAWTYFALRGGEEALVYWTLYNNAAYSANPVPVEEWLGRAAASVLPFLAVTAPLWWLWRRAPVDATDPYRRDLLAALVVSSLLAAAWGLRFYPHYLVPVYWPLALAAAPAATNLFFPLKRGGAWLLAYSTVLLVGFTVSTALLYSDRWPGRRVYRETDPVFRRVAERLRSDECVQGATLFVWGYAPIFYYEARLPPASRFVVLPQSRLTGYVSGNFASLTAAGSAAPGVVPRHWDWLLEDLERSRATYILDTAPARIFRWDNYPLADFPRLKDYVSARYDDVGSVDGVRIYRRRDCADPAAGRGGRTRPWPPF